MNAAFDLWVNPPPSDPALVASEAELRRVVRRNEAERRRIDQSWLNLIQQLRRDPDQLRHLPAATAQGVDSRLYHVWQLLSSAASSNARYAIETVRSIEPALGTELAASFRDGLIRHWRTWQPAAKSARPADSRNSINSLDAMGIAGVSMEAHPGRGWVETLDSELAKRAALYATLEINGFPAWLGELSERWPAEVSSVLLTEVKAELNSANERYGLLYAIGRADARTINIMIAPLLQEFEARSNLPPAILEPFLDVLEQATDEARRARLLKLCTERFSVAADTSGASLYIGTAYGIDSIAATNSLLERLDSLDPRDQTALVQGVLPAIFGTRFSRERKPPNIALRSLERLVRVAYRTIRIEDDRNRPSGVVYSPDSRDHAEDARGVAFKQLTEIPGLAAFDALLALAEVSEFPIEPARLRALARERAAKNSESAPWLPGEAGAFEEQCEILTVYRHRPSAPSAVTSQRRSAGPDPRRF